MCWLMCRRFVVFLIGCMVGMFCLCFGIRLRLVFLLDVCSLLLFV